MTGGHPEAADVEPVWEAIARKRAIRTFDGRPLEPEHLERIVDAGRHAPSSKNRQRWTFIVCQDREHLRELAAVGPFADHIAGAAAAIALVTPDPSSTTAGRSIDFDIGMAAENMMLAAWELGIGSVPATVYETESGPPTPGVSGRPCLPVPAVIWVSGRCG